jgi:hypothetical protein
MRTLLIAGLFVAGVTPSALRAQDFHYWSHQYGTRSNLLGGVVVGSVVDISASYYNPGALALIDSPDLFATSRVIEASNMTVSGAGNINVGLDDLQFTVAPGFFGGMLPFKFLGRHVLGYSFFTRHRFRSTLGTIQVGTEDLLDPPPGLEDLFAEVRLGSDLDESWFGLTWAAPLGSKFGVGVSNYVATRSRSSETLGFVEGFSAAGVAATSIQDRRFSYWTYDLLWKIGIAWEWQGWSLGLTLTTPRINLFGSGEYVVNATVFGQDIDQDGSEDPVFVADHQQKLSVDYRSPPSLALGMARTLGNTKIHTTAEWFGSVNEYTVIDPAPFVGQSIGDTVHVPLTQELDHVLNFGVGVEQTFSPTVSAYASFRTNFSARGSDPRTAWSVSRWDIFYLTAGASFELLGAGFTLGLGYGFGSSTLTRDVGQGGDFIDELPQELGIKYRNVRLIFAFAF